MPIVTITPKEYRNLLRRQERVETVLTTLLKQITESEAEELRIRPSVLRRWERISSDLDRGKGRAFSSVKEMKRWLNNL